MPGLFSSVLSSTSDIFNRAEAWMVYGGTSQNYIQNTNAGVPVSEERALTLSVWYAAVRNLSEDIAKLPLDVYRYIPAGGKERDSAHSVSALYGRAPNSYMTPIVYRQQMIHWLVGWGNAYAEIKRDARMNPIALEPIHPGRVKVKWNDSMTRVIYEVRNFDTASNRYAEVVEIDQDNMYHLRGLGSDPLIGYSVIRMAAESLALSLATEQFGASSFKNRGAIGAVLKHPGVMEPKAYDNFKKSFDASYRGAKNAGGWILLEDGMTYESMSLPPDDMQFIQTRTFQTEELLRWLRMPPSKVGHLNKANYNTLEMQNQEYVTDTLVGIAIKWEQEDKRKLFRADEMDNFTRHNFKGLLRGDQKAQTEHLTKLWGIGGYSVNDCLSYLDENPIGPEGDLRFVPSNYQELKVGMIAPWEAKQQQAAQKPATPPVAPKAALTEAQAYAVVWPSFDRVQKRAEKHIPVLQKRHGDDLAAFTLALADFNAEMRELVLSGLLDIWQSFDGDPDYLQATLAGNQPIVFEETARALASVLAERKAA